MYDYQTEYDMYLQDWSQEAMVTPREKAFLFVGHRTLVFSQQTHRYRYTALLLIYVAQVSMEYNDNLGGYISMCVYHTWQWWYSKLSS